MPKPVFLMTVQEAHKEYNSLTDQIWAKYEQLDLGKFGSPGTLHLMLKPVNWLIYLLVWANFYKTEPADSKGIIQADVLEALKIFRF